VARPSSPDAYFDAQSGETGEIARAARGPSGAGAASRGASRLGFPCYRGKERIFSIIARPRHVNLQLWNANRLTEAHPRVEGTGKQLR